MNEDKIKWCIRQKKGISLTEPKQHLAKAYMSEADDTLENVFLAKGKWKVITAYYACYNALYSILAMCGIKCEIHDCTIELMGLFDFAASDIKYIKMLKEDRIRTQYHLQDIVLKEEAKPKIFVSKCKGVLASLDSKQVEDVRKRIERLNLGTAQDGGNDD
ncbi:hypothetical protein HYY74_05190 [Candidatus Woesearchaeota archaeon]|nr:hypothetical protein [Candidatus Woesearchaeota archaeon]